MQSFDVFLNGKLIDTVYFSGHNEEEVKACLIDHDGYDSRIQIEEVK